MASTSGRRVVVPLTNKSGGSVVAGDVVIANAANDTSFTTTTTAAYAAGLIGVALEGIANDAVGRVAFAGYVPLVTVDASVTRGQFGKTHTAAKQATNAAARASGVFCQFLTGGTTPTAILFGAPDEGGGGAGAATTQGEYKTADQIVNNSSTMVNDTHLVLPIAASAVWAWELRLWYDSGTTPDLKIGWTYPSGATMRWSWIGATASGANEYGTTGVLIESSTQDLWGAGVGTFKHMQAVGTIINSTNAGNLQLQWAQNTANASDSTVRKHSSLTAVLVT